MPTSTLYDLYTGERPTRIKAHVQFYVQPALIHDCNVHGKAWTQSYSCHTDHTPAPNYGIHGKGASSPMDTPIHCGQWILQRGVCIKTLWSTVCDSTRRALWQVWFHVLGLDAGWILHHSISERLEFSLCNIVSPQFFDIKAHPPDLVGTFVSIDMHGYKRLVWVHDQTLQFQRKFWAGKYWGSRLTGPPARNILHEASLYASVFAGELQLSFQVFCLRILKECCLQPPCNTTIQQDLLQLLAILSQGCHITPLSTAQWNLFHLPHLCMVRCLPFTQQGEF